jgi:hypothetical protein
MKRFIDYYPNRIAKQNNFLRHSKDKKRFIEFCLGKDEYFHEDDSSPGLRKKADNLTLAQRIEREYLLSEFNLWEEWRSCGSNIFDLSEVLLRLLENTDVSDVQLSSIKLPYRNLYIDLQYGNLYLNPEKSIPVEGVFFSEHINDDESVTYQRVVMLDFTGKYIENYNAVNQQLMQHERGFHSYQLFLDPEENLNRVGQSVMDAKKSFVKFSVAEENADAKLDLYQIHSDFIHHTVNLVVNCLLYLTLKDNDIQQKFSADLPIHLKSKLEKATTKRKKELALIEIQQNGFTKIKLVGGRLNPIANFTGSGSQVSAHWRRGHWRNQKIGQHHQQIKLIWIMPTIVGKDNGMPQKGHLYISK